MGRKVWNHSSAYQNSQYGTKYPTEPLTIPTDLRAYYVSSLPKHFIKDYEMPDVRDKQTIIPTDVNQDRDQMNSQYGYQPTEPLTIQQT